ncbi:centrosomal protein of 290 kDa-like [Gigantopelta aegis]|uniref:centrosomal protein of 290 kDa-like n=1 Tax=Gigantopelta aegis TaxID=1735272 RepID=UPI001B88C374|nr:centrosomal protein of 290 kDa-like [Gigantopelta aegis]
MAPVDWDTVMKAKTSSLSDDDADNLFALLSEGDPGDETDAARLKKLFLVTRAVMVNKHQQAEGLMDEVEKEAVQNTKKEQEKEKEIKQLRKQIEELEKYGPADGGGTQRAAPIMREQLRELEEENEQLRTEIKELQRDLTNEKNAAEKYSARISDLEKDLKELRDDNDQMRQDISDYKMQLEAQRVNVVSQHGEEQMYRTKLKNKNHELAEAMEEIQNLTDQIEQLQSVNNNLQHQLAEATEQMSQITENDLKLKAVLQKSDSETDRLREENKILKNLVDDLTEQVQSKRESDDVIMVAVNNKIEEWKELVNEKNQQILDLQETVARLKEQLIAANMDTDKTSVSALGQIIMDKDHEIGELTERVQLYTEEMERSAAIIEDLKNELNRAEKGAGGERLQAKIVELQNESKNLKEEVKQLKEHVKQIEEDAQAKDKELIEALEQLDKYERGEYGLKYPVDVSNTVPSSIIYLPCLSSFRVNMDLNVLPLKLRDLADLEEFTQHINKAEMRINDILDENEELRYRLGLDPKEPLDMKEFKKNKAVRKEEDRALNFALQGEIERLEEERIDLKKKIRKLAQQTGQRAVALGLTAEDMLAVQDFTEELKIRKTQGQPTSTAARIVHDVEREDRHIRGEQIDREFLKNQLELDRKDEELSKLRVMVREVQEENKHLESGLKEVMEVMKKSGKETDSEIEPVSFPSIDKMLAAIEAKKVVGSYDTALYMKEQMDVLRGRNEELRAVLRETRVECNKLLLERDKAFDKIGKMEKDYQMFQEAGIAPGVFQPLPLPDGMAVSSTEVIASLNEHLVVVLQELSLKEENMKKIETALEDYKRKYAVMRHQQGLLYQDYLNDKKEWEAEMDKLKEELGKVRGEFEENTVRVQEFDRLIDTLSQDDVEVRRRLSEMTRRITVLRVNEKALTRRHQIMQEVEGNLRKEVNNCRNEMNQMQTTISERMGYLQRYKDMSSFKMAALQKSLEDSVPSCDLDKVNRQYHELTEKYRDLLEKGNTLVSRAEAVVGLQEEVKRLMSENEAIKRQAEMDKEKLHALEAAMEELHRRGFMDGADISVTDADIVSISKKITMLEMKELNERQRSEHAVRMYEQQREILRDLEARNKELEDKFAEVTKLNLEMQKAERKLRDELAISDRDRKRILDLEESELMLKQEISKLKVIG